MPTYAPVSRTTVETPAVLATLNEYMNKTLIPQGYVRTVFYGLLFGGQDEPGLGARPKVPIPSFRRPERKTVGGTQAEHILNFETQGNMQAFYDLGTLNTAINQGGTKVFSPFAHYSTYVAMARTQSKENSGPGKQYDILKSMLEQDMRFAVRKLETDLLSTNTDVNHNTGQDSMPGLRHWNSTSPSSGTILGLDRSVYTPFRNNIATITSFAATGIDQMQAMWYTTSGTNGNEAPDVIITTPTLHGYIAKQQQAIHRIIGSLENGDQGVRVLKYNDIPVMHTPDWPSGRQDWLNTEYLKAYVLEGCDWEQETPGKPNNVAITAEQRWYFTGTVMHLRPETNAVITVSGA